jgi:CspA family cold shock protein
MSTGKITRIVRDRGFGFIQSNDSTEEVFFHSTSLSGGVFDDLKEGQGVEFSIQPDPRNPRRTRAGDVKLTS